VVVTVVVVVVVVVAVVVVVVVVIVVVVVVVVVVIVVPLAALDIIEQPWLFLTDISRKYQSSDILISTRNTKHQSKTTI